MNGSTTSGIEVLKDVLDAYGADRTRWPAHKRRDLVALLHTSEEAQKLVRDAEAFDRMLDLAPAVSSARLEALTERIMAGAARAPRLAAGNPDIVRKPVKDWRRQAAGFAALAASLMIGVWAGQSQTMAPAVGSVAALAGIEIDTGTETGSRQLAAADETDIVIDEDLL